MTIKVLLITSSNPTGVGVGNEYLDYLINATPNINPVKLSVVNKSIASKACSAEKTSKHSIVGIAQSRWFPLSSFFLLRFMQKTLPDLERNVVELLCMHAPAKVWITLTSPELILLADALQRMENVKLYITICDVPEYVLGNRSLGGFLQQRVMHSFRSVVERSSAISVISKGMRDYLPASARAKSVVVANALTCEPQFKQGTKKPGILRIVFAGSLYAKGSWNALVSALVKHEFMVDGHSVELAFAGRVPRRGVKIPSDVTLLGSMGRAELNNLFADFDVGYAPYWFSSQHKVIAQTSFPGKISTYLSAGLRCFFHGPGYASVAEMRGLECFEICDSLESGEIIRSLKEMLRKLESGSSSVIEEFSSETVSRNFLRFLGQRDIH